MIGVWFEERVGVWANRPKELAVASGTGTVAVGGRVLGGLM